MKKVSIIAALTVLLLSPASTSKQSVYEKAIADYVQTDRHGTFTDLKFKALSIEKIADITIADSLKLLQVEFEELRDEQIASQQRTLDYFNGLLTDNQSAKYAKQAVDDQLNRSIAATQTRIDSLHNLPAAYSDLYKDRSLTEVVSVVVKCRYSYTMPGNGAAKERTDNFILLPDGKKVLGKEKSADL
ncbi:hypothetical protein EZS27_034504 [termite gut metagenome]|uniref:Uncharacterized protein n=1 Tax=termite gut metagenome TaxID=433724 RepID=A0A5J4Q2Y7_9ZZZZ